MDWELYMPAFSVRLTTGEKSTGPVMRRKRKDGAWEYRACTTEEEADYVSREAW